MLSYLYTYVVSDMWWNPIFGTQRYVWLNEKMYESMSTQADIDPILREVFYTLKIGGTNHTENHYTTLLDTLRMRQESHTPLLMYIPSAEKIDVSGVLFGTAQTESEQRVKYNPKWVFPFQTICNVANELTVDSSTSTWMIAFEMTRLKIIELRSINKSVARLYNDDVGSQWTLLNKLRDKTVDGTDIPGICSVMASRGSHSFMFCLGVYRALVSHLGEDTPIFENLKTIDKWKIERGIKSIRKLHWDQ